MTRPGDRLAPHRMDAALLRARRQPAMTAAVRQVLTVWLRQARREVLGAHLALTPTTARRNPGGLTAAGDGPAVPPDPEGVMRASAAMQSAIASYFAPVVGDSFGAAFAATLRAGVTISDQAYREQWVANATNRLSGVQATTYEQIRKLVADAVAHGTSVDTLALGVKEALTLGGGSPAAVMAGSTAMEAKTAARGAIRDLSQVAAGARDALWQSKMQAAAAALTDADRAYGRAQTALSDSSGLWSDQAAFRIGHDALMGALNGGTAAAADAYGQTTGDPLDLLWLSTDDQFTRPTHVEADGQRIGPGETFSVGGEDLAYPGDPDGSPAETYNCLRGDALVTWPGQHVRATTARRYRGPLIHLSTARGHVLSVTPNHPVLTPGGYRAAAGLAPGDHLIATGSPVTPQVDDVPPSVQQLHRAAADAGQAQWVVGGAVQFHGDGTDLPVQVVRADVASRDGGQAGGEQRALDRQLVGGLHAAGAALGGRGRYVLGKDDLRPDRRDVVAAGAVGGVRELAPLRRTERGHTQAVGLRAGAYSKPELTEAPDDRGPGDAEVARHLEHALAAGMTPCEVVQVHVDPDYHGDVFNLETTGAWYVANGVACHNCRCTLLTAGAGEDPFGGVTPDPDPWGTKGGDDGTGDGTVTADIDPSDKQ